MHPLSVKQEFEKMCQEIEGKCQVGPQKEHNRGRVLQVSNENSSLASRYQS